MKGYAQQLREQYPSEGCWTVDDLLLNKSKILENPFPPTSNEFTLQNIISYCQQKQLGDVAFLNSRNWRINKSKVIVQKLVEECFDCLWHLNISNRLTEKKISKEQAEIFRYQGGFLNSEFLFKSDNTKK